MSVQQTVETAMLEQLKDLLGERFQELVETFIRDGGRRMDLMRSAVPKRDFVTVHAEAHGLKGSARNIGANILGDVCCQLEQIGDAADEARLETNFAAVEQEFAAVCDTLRAYVTKA